LLKYWRLGCKVFRLKGNDIYSSEYENENDAIQLLLKGLLYMISFSSDYCLIESEDILCATRGKYNLRWDGYFDNCRSFIYLFTCWLSTINSPSNNSFNSIKYTIIRSTRSAELANLTIPKQSVTRWRNRDSPTCLIWTRSRQTPIYHGNNSSLPSKKVVWLQLNTLHSVCSSVPRLPWHEDRKDS
jgi:hypothetical protein